MENGVITEIIQEPLQMSGTLEKDGIVKLETKNFVMNKELFKIILTFFFYGCLIAPIYLFDPMIEQECSCPDPEIKLLAILYVFILALISGYACLDLFKRILDKIID